MAIRHSIEMDLVHPKVYVPLVISDRLTLILENEVVSFRIEISNRTADTVELFGRCRRSWKTDCR
ncbi:MAG: hypothetical protein P8M25_12510 [Paracoccaceae bacterium]|nr:hypothetical protein [Paracoccaceae bacterium]